MPRWPGSAWSPPRRPRRRPRRAVDVGPAGGPPLRRGVGACPDRGLPGRPVLRQRLAHHRRDGRHLDAAAEAARRHLVRDRRPVGRPGHEVHERLRLHALRAARHGGHQGRAHRRRPRRAPRRAVRPEADQPGRGAHRDREGRRALRAAHELPVGLRRRLAAREPAARRHRARSTATRSCSATRARCRTRTRPRTTTPRSSPPTATPIGGDDRRRPLRPAARHALHPPAGEPADGACRASATTARSARAPAASCATRSTCPRTATRTLWVAVAGSDKGLAPARARAAARARRPGRRAGRQDRRARAASRLHAALAARRPAAGTGRRLGQAEHRRPHAASPRTSRSATSTRASSTRRRRARSAQARWIGAGFPDYPWIFATDAEYTSFASVSIGQFEAIKDHMRALRDISDIVNERLGQGDPRDHRRRRELVRPEQGPGQHGRDRQVPEHGRADLALDRRRRLPRRDVRLLQAQPALRGAHARRRRRRLARGPRQRRAHRHGPGEARQHRLLDPRALRPRRHGAVQGRRRHRAVGAREGRRPARSASRARGGCPRSGCTPTR